MSADEWKKELLETCDYVILFKLNDFIRSAGEASFFRPFIKSITVLIIISQVKNAGLNKNENVRDVDRLSKTSESLCLR